MVFDLEGYTPGEMMVIVAGRQTGKSMLNEMFGKLSKDFMEPKPKYNFSRKWYVADFSDRDYMAVREWCVEMFGPEDKFPNAWSRWQHRYEHQIFFRDSKDYEWFVLRWS